MSSSVASTQAVLLGTVIASARQAPIAGALVIVNPEHSLAPDKTLAIVRTDQAGRYMIRLPPGRFDLYYERLGFTTLVRSGVVASSDKPDSVVVQLSPAPPIEMIPQTAH